MQIHIVAGGPLKYNLHSFKDEDIIWVGADRGTLTLIESGIYPKKAFGDFDSVTEDEKRKIYSYVENVEIFSPEKDETDTELALNWSLEQNPEKILLFAATGGRQDHFIANVQLLIQTVQKGYNCEVALIDEKNYITVKGPGTYSFHYDEEKKYVSFFSMTEEVKSLSLSGFKYPLSNKNLMLGEPLCISNELIYEVGTFSFTHGILMVIRSSD